MKPEDFYTKPACNQAQILELFLPDGSSSGEYIEVYGIDSDAYDKAMAENQRQLLALDIATSMQKAKALEDSNTPEAFDSAVKKLQRLGDDRQAVLTSRELETKAALIAGWSFDKELTTASAVEFLRNCPQIAQRIDAFASNRANFLKKK